MGIKISAKLVSYFNRQQSMKTLYTKPDLSAVFFYKDYTSLIVHGYDNLLTFFFLINYPIHIDTISIDLSIL